MVYKRGCVEDLSYPAKDIQNFEARMQKSKHRKKKMSVTELNATQFCKNNIQIAPWCLSSVLCPNSKLACTDK